MEGEEKAVGTLGVPVISIKEDELELGEGIAINASGHVQELDRNFNFWSIASTGITSGCAWPVLGGTIVTALYNGGAPGVLYEFIAVCCFYGIITVSLAELASAIPSSAGVYHWASVTPGPRHGKTVGFFGGWWNVFAWIFGATSATQIQGQAVMAMWSSFHPNYVFQRWHVFIISIIEMWLACGVLIFFNKALPRIFLVGIVVLLSGLFVTIVVCAAMPSTTGSGHASNESIWREFENTTGYGSSGFAFLLGMLNGAYTVGTPDCISHLAEEIPNPRVNIPKGMIVQIIFGFSSAFVYAISILYASADLADVTTATSTFPLADIYHQATNSRGGMVGLLLIIYFASIVPVIGNFLTAGRMLWTLARDRATPFSGFLSKVSPTFHNPLRATVAVVGISTALNCIYIGSSTAFSAFVGSFTILTTVSYVSAILPHLLTNRKHIVPGPFYMKGWTGMAVHGLAASYIIVFVVIFCFPFSLPVSVQTMNYACVTTGGLSILVGVWWIILQFMGGYEGPKVMTAG